MGICSSAESPWQFCPISITSFPRASTSSISSSCVSSKNASPLISTSSASSAISVWAMPAISSPIIYTAFPLQNSTSSALQSSKYTELQGPVFLFSIKNPAAAFNAPSAAARVFGDFNGAPYRFSRRIQAENGSGVETSAILPPNSQPIHAPRENWQTWLFGRY